MPRIQKQKTRKVGEVQYYKYVIVVPESFIKRADLNEGDIVSTQVLGKGRILFKREKRASK